MALNLKNPRVEHLAQELAVLCGETKTTAIRVALEERRERLLLRSARPRRAEQIEMFLKREIWPVFAGGKQITKAERERILGYGKAGV